MIVSDLQSGFSGITHNTVLSLLDRLDLAYPVFNGCWRIAVNEAGGVITVTNIMLGNNNGFVMHLDKIDPEGRKVVMYAGELLERYRISRSRDASVVLDDIVTADRDFAGKMVCDNA